MSQTQAAVFIHGAANSKGVWRFWERAFADAGWVSRAVDLRGHGNDGRELSHASMADYADDAAEAIEDVQRDVGAAPVVVGWSMGGLIAMMCAQRGLASACVCLAPSMPSRSREAYAELREGVFGPEAYGITSSAPNDQPMMADLTLEERALALASLGPESQYARDDRYAGIVIETLPCPLLIVTGTADMQWPRWKYDELWLPADFLMVEGASHWGLVLSERAVSAVAPRVLGWLQRQG